MKPGHSVYRRLRLPPLIALLVGALLSWQALAPMARAAEPAAGAGSAMPDYHPSFGDLMTMAVQPRHIKLGIAGQAGNWAYAAYEVSELRNAFARIARTIPRYNGAATQILFNSMVGDALASVSSAIENHDAAEFRRTYAGLTAACNACHVSQRHGFVVITVPSASPYADQELRMIKP